VRIKDDQCFPFGLRLEKNLKVDVHDPGVLNRIMRLLGVDAKEDCWRFKIKAPYKPKDAKAALEDAEFALTSNKMPSFIGLHAAVKPWMDAQAMTMFTSPGTTPAPEAAR